MKNTFLKYFLLIAVLVLVVPFLLKTFLPAEKPTEMLEMFAKQKNPFAVSKDSSELVWNRASQFLEKRKLIIVGGDLEKNDTVIYMPYYNDFHKGTSLKIERKQIADLTLFTVSVWNSGKPVPLGAKEIALYMKTGIDRIDYNKKGKQHLKYNNNVLIDNKLFNQTLNKGVYLLEIEKEGSKTTKITDCKLEFSESQKTKNTTIVVFFCAYKGGNFV